MKIKNLFAVIVALVVITAGVVVVFQNQNYVEEETPKGNDDAEPLGDIVYRDIVNDFNFDFFKELETGDNIFISPYSIFTALSMTYEGAKGDTASEMMSVLKIQQDNDSFHSYMKDLYQLLNKKNEKYNISTANALWLKKDLELMENYLNVIRTYYGGEATEVDYSNAQRAADTINEWVENNTNGLIKDLILADYINPLTALILTNAIYFKGIWEVQFDKENTTDRDFYLESDETVNVSTMSLVNTENLFNYTETDDLQMLELPYSGDDLSMVIILPKNNDLDAIINSIDSETYMNLIENMTERKADIYLPRFKVETKYMLKNNLMNLGMNTAFTSSADFSGITGKPDLFISEVVHKAYIDVNEEGTEAAAATAVIMELTSTGDDEPTRIIFNCDHPFIYLIQHKQTGTILFMGSIFNPA